MMVTKRKLENTYGFILDEYELRCINKIFVIGCGGNGSHLVSDLARMISNLDQTIEIILVDGDVVDQGNLGRQHFTEADLGRNKAEVLAVRYGNAYGTPIGFLGEYLSSGNKDSVFTAVGRPQLFISCTDNLRSRKIIAGQRGSIWIDLGNEEVGGQVTFSSLIEPSYRGKRIRNGEAFPTPHVFEIFPEYDQKVKEEVGVEQLSCADMGSPAQAGFVNVTCAAIAKNYIQALLMRRPIKSFQTFFTIDNSFESRSMTKSAIKYWVEKYKRFAGYRIA
jgi:PRTRC genetic system ThiF family protein